MTKPGFGAPHAWCSRSANLASNSPRSRKLFCVSLGNQCFCDLSASRPDFFIVCCLHSDPYNDHHNCMRYISHFQVKFSHHPSPLPAIHAHRHRPATAVCCTCVGLRGSPCAAVSSAGCSPPPPTSFATAAAGARSAPPSSMAPSAPPADGRKRASVPGKTLALRRLSPGRC